MICIIKKQTIEVTTNNNMHITINEIVRIRQLLFAHATFLSFL